MTRQLLNVVDRLYTAVMEPDRWSAFLEAAANALDARGAQLGHTDLVRHRLTFSLVHGYDWSQAHMQRYESLMGEDPRLAHFSANRFKPVHCRMAVTEEQLHASRVYKEVLSVGGVEYSLGVNLVDDTQSLIYFLVLRDRTQPPFGNDECEKLALLVPHLARALRLQREFYSLDLSNRVAFGTLDGMSVGVVIIDSGARVRFASRMAEEITGDRDGISFINGRLAIEGDDSVDIRALAANVTEKVARGACFEAEPLHVQRPSEREPYSLVVGGFNGDQGRFPWTSPDRPLALVLIRDPEKPAETRVETLRRLYGLTDSQARLTECLAGGRSLRQSAGDLGITEASARQYLKLVFHKMGVNRQGDLIRKVMQSPSITLAEG